MNEAKKQPEESEESVAENASPEDDVGAEAIDLGPAEEAEDPIAILEAEKVREPGQAVSKVRQLNC